MSTPYAGTRYPVEMDDWLVHYVPGHHHAETAAAFNEHFGVDWMTPKLCNSWAKRHNVKTGFTGYFPKGGISHNKGKKMPPEIYEKLQATMFKAGNRPHNAKPVGTEIIDNKDGYHWIKVAEPDTWRQKHHLIWEEANGQKVPEGCIIRFADGDKENFSPNNLICVSQSVNLEMNRRGYDPAGSTELGKVQATTATLEVLRRKKKNGSE